MSTLPNQPEYDPYDGNPVIAEAVKALTFGGEIPAAEIPRDRAERLLSMWAHDTLLTTRERVAILSRFTQSAEASSAAELDDVVEAFRIGQEIGARRENALADKVFEHAFTVDFDPDSQLFAWRCRCGWQHAQALDERDVRTALIMHLEAGTPGHSRRDIAEYRKRLDVWSKDQQRLLDERFPDGE